MPPKHNQTYQPPVFNNRTENYDIETEINTIQEQRKLFSIDEVRQLHVEFATDNPELFKKCYENEMNDNDIEQLVFMLKLRKRVKDKEITFQEANNIVSVYFAQKYQPELLTKDGFGKPNK